jgi:hypothetical protein
MVSEDQDVGKDKSMSLWTPEKLGEKAKADAENDNYIHHHLLWKCRKKCSIPSFTTKPAGECTGLGPSMSHDIVVKQHGGTIDVDTEASLFTEFIIMLPRNAATQVNAGGKN